MPIAHLVYGTELTKQFINHDSSQIALFLKKVSQLVRERFQLLYKKACDIMPDSVSVFRVI